MKLSVTFKQRCEAISTNLRSELGLYAYDRLPANTLATKFEASILAPQDIKDIQYEHIEQLLSKGRGWSAMIISHKPLKILYNPNHYPNRYESNIMHELAHFILKHPMAKIDPETGLPLLNQKYEEEATYLGSCLQIPKRGLLWAKQKRLSKEQIALHFGASESLVSFRLNLTG